jgi:hypothetical protein
MLQADLMRSAYFIGKAYGHSKLPFKYPELAIGVSQG